MSAVLGQLIVAERAHPLSIHQNFVFQTFKSCSSLICCSVILSSGIAASFVI